MSSLWLHTAVGKGLMYEAEKVGCDQLELFGLSINMLASTKKQFVNSAWCLTSHNYLNDFVLLGQCDLVIKQNYDRDDCSHNKLGSYTCLY